MRQCCSTQATEYVVFRLFFIDEGKGSLVAVSSSVLASVLIQLYFYLVLS